MHLYDISADGGKTYTTQWLTDAEVEEHKRNGYIVNKVYFDIAPYMFAKSEIGGRHVT